MPRRHNQRFFWPGTRPHLGQDWICSHTCNRRIKARRKGAGRANDLGANGQTQNTGVWKTPYYGSALAGFIWPTHRGRPGIPADRVKVLRDSFLKAMSDPELLAEAEKRGWEPDPVTGDKLQALAREVVAQPPEVIKRMNVILGK